jgi:hypothetical protein
VVAGLIYAGFMATLTFATSPWQIYALTVPAAAGAAALLSMPLTYFQDLFPGRPGLGTSFNPINSFLGNGHGMARRRDGACRHFRPCATLKTPRGRDLTQHEALDSPLVWINPVFEGLREPCRKRKPISPSSQ